MVKILNMRPHLRDYPDTNGGDGGRVKGLTKAHLTKLNQIQKIGAKSAIGYSRTAASTTGSWIRIRTPKTVQSCA